MQWDMVLNEDLLLPLPSEDSIESVGRKRVKWFDEQRGILATCQTPLLCKRRLRSKHIICLEKLPGTNEYFSLRYALDHGADAFGDLSIDSSLIFVPTGVVQKSAKGTGKAMPVYRAMVYWLLATTTSSGILRSLNWHYVCPKKFLGVFGNRCRWSELVSGTLLFRANWIPCYIPSLDFDHMSRMFSTFLLAIYYRPTSAFDFLPGHQPRPAMVSCCFTEWLCRTGA